jgi:hypothetical protein
MVKTTNGQLVVQSGYFRSLQDAASRWFFTKIVKIEEIVQ